MDKKLHYTKKSGYFTCKAQGECPLGSHIIKGSLNYKMGFIEHELEKNAEQYKNGLITETDFLNKKRLIMKEGYKTIAEHDKERVEVVKNLVPRGFNEELNLYYSQTDKKHFGDTNSPGSQFISPNVNRIEDVLSLAFNQRGNLNGDDRNVLIELGSDPSVFLDNFRYLYVETEGVLGIKNTSTMPDNQELKVVRTKDKAKPNLAAIVTQKDTVNYGVIIIGYDDEVGKEIFITSYPGLVTKKSEDSSNVLEKNLNKVFTVKEMREKLGHDIWVNTYLAE